MLSESISLAKKGNNQLVTQVRKNYLQGLISELQYKDLLQSLTENLKNVIAEYQSNACQCGALGFKLTKDPVAQTLILLCQQCGIRRK